MGLEENYLVCKSIKDEKKRFVCLVNVLKETTELQDKIQLSVPPLTEGIATIKSIVNDANAIILEASRWNYDIEKFVNHGYAKEKVKNIVNDWNTIAKDFSLATGNEATLFKIREEKFKKEPIPETREKELKQLILFKGL